eukprot:CAMPEP_0168164824 /NCGR_PEP_ID=MMETSP0139_2-20121125/1148_1 /TAXON_ID=44445 /ORGANISM="Pseudo-nitzschia australis, Strain 10249 10 AB" /LENGTH=525 /DNA_ID=CAMNT_0008081877 /DNA_START=120 /DNA_END=1697 /DNA_ORIENTATION=+
MTATLAAHLSANLGQTERTTTTTTTRKRLVLIGGGHSHLQVIKGLNYASRPKDLDVVLIDVTDRPCYSGMVPSAVAGIYSPEETLVELKPLAEWSKIDFIQDRVVDIDMDEKIVITASNNRISFDAISIDIGSTSRGLTDIAGAKDYTIPTRPITELVRRIGMATDVMKEYKKNIHDNEQQQRKQSIASVVVVGGGAAGMELSMAVLTRWKSVLGKNNVSVTVLNSFNKLFPDETTANREALVERLKERGIFVINNAKVERVDENSLLLESGERLEFTHCIWATGADCHLEIVSALRQRGLAISKNGWIQVNESFQSLSHPFVFAAGDCCTMEIPGGGRSPPKAGVYAVRAGPILIENLTRFLINKERKVSSSDSSDQAKGWDVDTINSSLKTYESQKDFLKLLACGDGKALGFRFGIPFYGKWVFELKDAIDRSFMELFQKENLPELIEGEPYDTSQYDATSNRPPPIASIEAAMLLQRSDDDVEFRKAWDVLRDMAEDDAYQDEVLKHIGLGVSSMDMLLAVR